MLKLVSASLLSAALLIAPQAQAATSVAYRSGPLLRSPQLHLLFWGRYWATPAGRDDVAFFERFLAAFAPSDTFVSEVVEYSAADYRLGPGALVSSATFADQQPATGDEFETEAFINAAIDAGAVPQPAGEIVYVVFLPPGAKGVPHAEAYHDYDYGRGYAFISTHYEPYFGDLLGVGRDIATASLAHELAETVTDPLPGSGWTSPADGQEIGDLCWGKVAIFSGGGHVYSIQQEWSNEQGKCIASRDVAPAGGGCAAGQHRDGDYCVPDLVGCSSSGAAPGGGLLALASLALLCRRRSVR